MQLVMIMTFPIVASLSDRMQCGPYPATAIGTLCVTVAAIPMFAIINASSGDPRVLVPCIGIGYGLLLALLFGTYHIFFVDLFPTHVRAMAFGISFNTSFAIFGGFVGVISEALVRVTPLGPAYYATGVGLVSTAVLLWSRCMFARGSIELQHFPRSEIQDSETSKSEDIAVSI